MKHNEQNILNASCYHCGLAIADGETFTVEIDQGLQPMCCAGCQAVAQAIMDNDLGDYYRYRDVSKATKPAELIPQALTNSEVYDRPNVRNQYTKSLGKDLDEITLMLEGLNCAACAWLIEKQLNKQNGIESIEVNYTSLTAKLKWNQEQIALSKILNLIRNIGYIAIPFEPRIQYQQLLTAHSQQLKRIGITAVLGMQVMIISVALYFGHYSGIDDSWKQFFHKLGLLFTLPIMFYSAQSFFKASFKQLLSLQAGMDVPVCLGLTLAFTASVWTTVSGHGEVYYDSVTMFVFLLLVARYFMHGSVLAASHNIERLAANSPMVALRLKQHSTSSLGETITAEELRRGDWIRVLAGYVIPADGVVVSGSSTVNQALISGESKPISVDIDDNVIAGSLNNKNPLIIKVTASGTNTVFGGIEKLARQGLQQNPVQLQFIDWIAKWFVVSVLVIAATVALFWWQFDSGQWLANTIAVLVVSCPCALSLSVPSAYAATTSKLIENGSMLTDSTAIEKLTHVCHVVFDKTGTLTRENLVIEKITTHAQIDQQTALQLAASLEINSDHPLAVSFIKTNKGNLKPVEDWHYQTGLGVAAKIDSRQLYLGSAQFINQATGVDMSRSENNSVVFLADHTGVLAEFIFSYSLRDGVVDVLTYFKNQGKTVSMLTGDDREPANALAHQLKIENVYSECKPHEKLNVINKLKKQHGTVLMIGDGINDSPVLAGADVSIAVAGASPLAVSGADIVMVNPSLKAIISLHKAALKTAKIIRQNISWAIAYNLLAIPFAASGIINPLFAAVGMSLSSILVVLNAQRLRSKL